MATFEYLRDAFAVIGFVSVMCSLAIAGVAGLGAWLEGRE